MYFQNVMVHSHDIFVSIICCETIRYIVNVNVGAATSLFFSALLTKFLSKPYLCTIISSFTVRRKFGLVVRCALISEIICQSLQVPPVQTIIQPICRDVENHVIERLTSSACSYTYYYTRATNVHSEFWLSAISWIHWNATEHKHQFATSKRLTFF